MDNLEDTRYVDSISRLALVDQIVFENDLHRSRKLSWWCILWHLLNNDSLRVLIDTVSVLSRVWVALSIFGGEDIGSLLGLGLIDSQVVLIVIVLDNTLLGLLAVVN